MKKLSVILIVVALITCVFALASADDFSLHSSVKFDMRIDEVKAAEEAKGFTCVEKKLKYAFYDTDGGYYMKETQGLVVEGSIAGIEDSKIYYYFNDYDRLFEAIYIFKGANDQIREQFLAVDGQLEKKYSGEWIDCSEETYPNSIDVIISSGQKLISNKAHKIRINDKESVYMTHWLTAYLYTEKGSFVPDYEKCMKESGEHYLAYRLISDASIDELKNKEEEARLEEERKEQERKEEEERKQQEQQQQLEDDL